MPPRSPAIFWLLLAATLAVDAVAIYWIFNEKNSAASAIFWIALSFAQISVITVWAILLAPKVGLRWLAPLVGGFVVALIVFQANSHARSSTYLFDITGLMWGHAILAMSLLWMLKPTRWLAKWRDGVNPRRWQFSIAHILTLMTCVSVLCVLLGNVELLARDAKYAITLAIANAMLVLAVLLIFERISVRVLRFAANVGVAIAIAAICELMDVAFAREINSFAFNLIQMTVLWSWIEVIAPSSPSISTSTATASDDQ